MRYAVETRMLCGWENVWKEDGKTLTFDSEEDAIAEIEDTIECMESAYRRGDISSPMTHDDFRIVKL